MLPGIFFDGREFICVRCRVTPLGIPFSEVEDITQAQITELLRGRKKQK
jgi:hypothetical protein